MWPVTLESVNQYKIFFTFKVIENLSAAFSAFSKLLTLTNSANLSMTLRSSLYISIARS